MNIPNEIYEYAQKYGIDWTSTGGGCDFITRTIGDTELKLADPDDTGWCPESIDNERSEEHTSELQSRLHLVCRLLLEKKD